LAELTDPLTPDVARQVEEAVLPDAAGQNTSELARATRKAIALLDPDGAQQRHAVRKKDRRVELIPAEDAMAWLNAYLPAADATRIHQRLDAFAHAAPPDDERTMDQRRADVLIDLLLGRPTTDNTGGPGGVVVHVTVPATMLMGLDNQPGELAGYGPIPADVARKLAGDATWKRLLNDPISGQLLDYGRTTYRPPAGLADYIRARDHHCLFPGCARPAAACDIDHRTPYPDGPTNEENSGCLCRHHHRLKHEGGWTLTRNPDGTHTWTTPENLQYHRKPIPIAQPQPPPKPAPPAVKPDDEPPPF
jgi:hypothetical protein